MTGHHAGRKQQREAEAEALHQRAIHQDGQETAAVHARVRAVGDHQHHGQAQRRRHTAGHDDALQAVSRHRLHQIHVPPEYVQHGQGHRGEHQQAQADRQPEGVGRHQPVGQQEEVEDHQRHRPADHEVADARLVGAVDEALLLRLIEAQHRLAVVPAHPFAHSHHDAHALPSPAAGVQRITPSPPMSQTRLRPCALAA